MRSPLSPVPRPSYSAEASRVTKRRRSASAMAGAEVATAFWPCPVAIDSAALNSPAWRQSEARVRRPKRTSCRFMEMIEKLICFP